MIQKEIKDQNNYIDKVKAAIRAKGPPLKVNFLGDNSFQWDVLL